MASGDKKPMPPSSFELHAMGQVRIHNRVTAGPKEAADEGQKPWRNVFLMTRWTIVPDSPLVSDTNDATIAVNSRHAVCVWQKVSRLQTVLLSVCGRLTLFWEFADRIGVLSHRGQFVLQLVAAPRERLAGGGRHGGGRDAVGVGACWSAGQGRMELSRGPDI